MIPGVLSLPILLSFVDKHKLTPVFITDVKLNGFALFLREIITLLSNTLLTQFIKQCGQSTLCTTKIRAGGHKRVNILLECLPVFCITVYFSDVSLKKICVGLL